MNFSIVVAALKGKGSASDPIRLIERRFAADPSCGHCGERSFGQWGTSGNGFKRYKCKCCGKTFTVLIGTPLSRRYRVCTSATGGSSMPARLPDYSAKRIAELLPWNWKTARKQAQAA